MNKIDTGLDGLELIILDAEVYAHDWLMGFKIHRTGEYVQIHNDFDALKDLLDKYDNGMFFTVNGSNYDNHIIKELLNYKNPYTMSKRIIEKNKVPWSKLPILTYDLLKPMTGNYPSLKVFESNIGMDIQELPIAPTFEEKLTPERLERLAVYNRHDLDATEQYMLQRWNESIMVKARLIKYFGIDFKKYIDSTIVKIMEVGLQAKSSDFPELKFRDMELAFSKLDIKNETIYNYFANDEYENGPLIIEICGVVHHIKGGGIHGAVDGYVAREKTWHGDFEAFYPGMMVLLGLLSRALGEDGREKFDRVRLDRLEFKRLKHEFDQPLKTGIAAMSGATNAPKSEMYDPSMIKLLWLYGQAYIIDLLEKLEPYIILYQSNTDGIIFDLKNDSYLDNVKDIFKAFEERLGISIELEVYEKLRQRNVNNYLALVNGKVKALGGKVNVWNLTPETCFHKSSYKVLQESIIDTGIVNYLLYEISPEETVAKAVENGEFYKFQSTSKIGKSFVDVRRVSIDTQLYEQKDEMTNILKDKEIRKLLRTEFKLSSIKDYDEFESLVNSSLLTKEQLEALDVLGVRVLRQSETEEVVKHTNRVFASNDKSNTVGLFKYKYVEVKATGEIVLSRYKIPNLPTNLFIFNEDMKYFYKVIDQLDLEYYVEKIYKEIEEFRSGAID